MFGEMNVPTSKRNLDSGKTEVPSMKKARKEKACTSTGDSEDAHIVGNNFSTSIHGVPELLKAVYGGTQELESTSQEEQRMQVEPEPSPANEYTDEERIQQLQIATPLRSNNILPQLLRCSPPMELLAPFNLCPFGETVMPVRSEWSTVSDELQVLCNVGSFGQTRVAGFQTVSTDSVSATPTIQRQLESTSQEEQSMQVEPEPYPANECTDEERIQQLQIATPLRSMNILPQLLQCSAPMELPAPLNLCPFWEIGMPVRSDPDTVSDELQVVCNLGSFGQTRAAGFQTVSTDSASTTPTIQRELKDPHSTLQLKGAAILEDGRVSKPHGRHYCEKCCECFPTVVALERHFRIYHVPRTCYPCPICKVFYAKLYNVYRHLTKRHHISEEHLVLFKPIVLSKATKRELHRGTRPTSEALAPTDIAKLEAKEEAKCEKSCSTTAAFTTHSTKCKLRRDCCKPSSTIALPCFCPEPCAIHQSLPSRLDAVVEKVQGMSATNEKEEPSTSSSKNEDIVEDITSDSSDVNIVD